MKHLIIILALLFTLPAWSQRLPNQFPLKSSAEGTDELYTQASGVAYRIKLDTVRLFMSADIDLTPLAYNIDSTGANVVDSLRGRFVIDLSGDWWYVDKDKKAVLIGAPETGQANTGANVGDGTGVFYQKSGVQLQFKSLKVGGINSIASTDTTITITGTEVDGSTTNELGSVSVITNVPDTTSLTPKAGDMFVNAAKDTMGIYATSWVLFFGGSPGDNLGDHIATQNLNMAGNTILGGTGTTSDLILQTTSGVGATGADMFFLVGNNGGTEAMKILNNGNVGIGGATTPAQTLHVQGTARITGSDGTPTGLMGRDADGDVGAVSLGTGLTLTTGTLTANDTVTTLIQDSILVYSVAGVETGRDTVSTPGSGGGSGTVTSVGLSLPSQFAVTGSPVTSSGTLTGAWNTQTANTVLAGPTTGAAAAPTFRALVAADITAGGGATGTGAANYVAYWNGATSLTGSSAFQYDGTNIGIGGAGSYALDASSKTGAFRLPIGLDAQRPATATALLRYSSTTSGLEGYSTAWYKIVESSFNRGTAGTVPYLGSDGRLSGSNSDFFWDSSNKRLGVGNNSPSYEIHAKKASGGYVRISTENTLNGTSSGSQFRAINSDGDFGTLTVYNSNLSQTALAGKVAFTSNKDFVLLTNSTLNNGGTGSLLMRLGGIDATNDAFYFDYTKKMGITTNTPAYSIDAGTATDGFKIPVGTTAQRPTGADGVIRYNSTNSAFEGYGSIWRNFIAGQIGSASGTTDASGDFTVTHNLGTTPVQVLITNTDATTPRFLNVIAKGATTFTVRVFDSTGAAVNAGAYSIDWIAK